MSEKKEKNEKPRDGFFVRQIKVYGRYFMYKPTTNKIIGKKISPKDFKEIFTTYKTLEEPKKSFKRAMEVEGVVEADLVKAHARYTYFQVGILAVFPVPLYHFFNVINHVMSGGDFTLGFLPSIFPPIVSMLFLAFFYIYFAWIQWRIRNKCLATHRRFMNIVFKYPSELVPLQEYEDTMEKKYGEGWESKNKNKKQKEF
jgi:hypothetical protein